MRIAPLLSDTETLLTYGAPIWLARTAIGIVRGEEAKGSEYFGTSGELVRFGGGSQGEMTIRFAEPNEEALAFILGARIDANGVVVSGGYAPPHFALGYEAFAVESEYEELTARDTEDAFVREGANEKTWFYKCRARLGQYTRTGARGKPKAAEIQLIVTTLATRRRFEGAPLTGTYLPAGAEPVGAGSAWFDEVYIPEERIWTS